MGFVSIKDQVKFELSETLCWGVKEGLHGGYSVPISLNDSDVARIASTAEDNGARNPLYGNTLYLKLRVLSDKQKTELLNAGRAKIMVHFNVTGVYTKNDVTHIVTKVCRLRKLEDVAEEAPED